MEPITIDEIIKATKGRLIQGDRDYLVKNISIDSRKILPNDLFVAIKGKTYDGHNFITQSLEKGACGVVIDNKQFLNKQLQFDSSNQVNIIEVENTIQALGDIASYYRQKFSPIVIAITGSNGKTTTKDMTAHILNRKYKIVKAPESFNNDIGVPLTVLQLTKDTEVLILEMEMNILGGIKRLCEISQPQIGVITNIGDTHLEFLHTREGVLKEKSELLEAVTDSGVAIVNADDPMLMHIVPNFKFKALYTFGIDKPADIFADKIVDHYENGTEFLLNSKYWVKLNVPGRYNIYNALGAISIARTIGREFDEIIANLADFSPSRMRMEKIEINGITIYNDAFNANPQSVLSAINTFANFTKNQGKKIVVLSDMLELGEKSIELHRWVGSQIPEGVDILLTVGEGAKYIGESAQKKGRPQQIYICRDLTEATQKLVDILNITDKILIKGSRLMRLETIIDKLKEYYDKIKSSNKTGNHY